MNRLKKDFNSSKFFWFLAYITIFSFVVILFIWSKKIEDESYKIANTYARLYPLLLDNRLPDDIRSFLFDEILKNSVVPFIITDKDGNIQTWKGFKITVEEAKKDSSKLKKIKKILKRIDKKNPPIPLYYNFKDTTIVIGYLHYENLTNIGIVESMPIILFFITLIFAYITFTGYRILQEREKEIIFQALMKETAHQLGTPISSILGWIDILREEFKENNIIDKEKILEYLDEIQKDADRLKTINHRFEYIGSLPEKKEGNINKTITKVCEYFKKRIPKNIRLYTSLAAVPNLYYNEVLIEWVFENLIKNSIDALYKVKDAVIYIETLYDDKKDEIVINFWDNGVGIPSDIRDKIFDSGFTTKNKGWGLGLTLVKRIIEDYHHGSIVLKESIPYKKTLFEIRLKVR